MKLKHLFFAASMALCGVAFAQEHPSKVYVVDANVSLTCSAIDLVQDDDGNTTVTFGDNVVQEPGNTGGCNKQYLGNVNGVVGPWTWYSTIICSFTSNRQCIWTN